MMPAPFIWVSEESTIKALDDGLSKAEESGCASVLIMACSDNDYDCESLKSLLGGYSLPVCGGLFPKIVSESRVLSEGVIIVGLMVAPAIITVTDLADENVIGQAEKASLAIEDYDNFVIITDAFCPSNEDFIDHLYECVGSGMKVIGGGAGFLDFIQRPCLFTNDGLVDNAVQIIALSQSLERGIGHGWEILDGPYLVTASQGHFIETLDFRPAFALYQDAISKVGGRQINEDNFFTIAKDFPLGIACLNDEMLVRDPVRVHGTRLECVGNVPINSTVYLLQGDQVNMVASAGRAAQSLNVTEFAHMFLLFDCISRGLYMGEEFVQELDAIKNTAVKLPLVGVLPLGEVTNIYSGALHLLNKSTVIGVL